MIKRNIASNQESVSVLIKTNICERFAIAIC